MVEITNKIIVNLIDNIEKYRVRMYKHSDTMHNKHNGFTVFFYPMPDCESCLQIESSDKITVTYSGRAGARLVSEVIEDEKYELLNNFQKLFRACTNYTSTQMRMFADSFDEEDLNDL